MQGIIKLQFPLPIDFPEKYKKQDERAEMILYGLYIMEGKSLTPVLYGPYIIEGKSLLNN